MLRSLAPLAGACLALAVFADPAQAVNPAPTFEPVFVAGGDCDDRRNGQDEARKQDADQSAPREWLTIGDPAPELDITYWLKGREIESFRKKDITVLVFWASWSMPSRNIVPVLSSLQERYDDDDVSFVVISDERPQTLVKFLAEPGWYDTMDFSIATDPKRSTQRAYMEAAAIGSIPSAFLIGRDGRLDWIGHPRDLAAPLDAVVHETWDRAAAKARFEEEIASARELYVRMEAMKSAFRNEDWPRLLEMFDEAIAATEDNTQLKIQKFQLLIGAMNRPEEGYAYGRELLKQFWSDPGALNNLAWYVVDYERVRTRDFEFAMNAARRAVELTKGENAAILDTVARIHYEQGDLDAALEWQRRAVSALTPGDPAAGAVRRAMERYERKARDRDGSPRE